MVQSGQEIDVERQRQTRYQISCDQCNFDRGGETDFLSRRRWHTGILTSTRRGNMHLNIFPLLSHFLIFVNVYCDTSVYRVTGYRVNLPSHRAVLSSEFFVVQADLVSTRSAVQASLQAAVIGNV